MTEQVPGLWRVKYVGRHIRTVPKSLPNGTEDRHIYHKISNTHIIESSLHCSQSVICMVMTAFEEWRVYFWQMTLYPQQSCRIWVVPWVGELWQSVSIFCAHTYSFRSGPTSQANQVIPVSGCGIPDKDIDWLTQRTHYTSEEIQILYNGRARCAWHQHSSP